MLIYYLKKNFKYLVLLQVIALFILIMYVIYIYHKKDVIDIEPEKWTSNCIAYNNGAWYVDENTLSSDAVITLLSGPNIKLLQGTYWVTIDYECEYDQSCILFPDGGNSYIRDNIVKLPENLTSISRRIDFATDIDDFDVSVQYNGRGAFQINKIIISLGRRAVISRELLVFCVFIFLFSDIYILSYEKISRNKKAALSLLGISMMASLPLFMDGISFMPVQDLNFHLNRIEAIAYELGNGTFPVKLSSYWNFGYGYPSSIYYGDILLYFPAVLRLSGFTIEMSYKIFVVFINMGTTAISYVCFKRIWNDKDIALLTCLAYMTAGYRIVNIYVRAAVGEFSAMMFLPIIAMSIYKIYKDDCADWKNYRKNAFWLIVGMSGVIGTHVLTTEMVLFALLLICVVLLRKTFRKSTLGVFGLSILGTLLLSSYYIVPFLDYTLHESVSVIQDTADRLQIQSRGAYIGQYFDFFQSIYGWASKDINNRMQLTPGPVLMGALFFVFYFKFRNNKNKEIQFFTVFSGLMLFLASNLFPWDFLSSNSKIFNSLAVIQVPWRYITLAVIFLTMLMGCMLKILITEDFELYKKIFALVVGICIFMSCFYLHSYEDRAQMVYFGEAAELDTESDTLYLPSGTDRNLFDNNVSSEDMNKVKITYRKGAYMELDCEAGSSEGTVTLPVLNYKGYHVTDEFGTEYEIFDGANNTIQFMLPAGFSGKVFVDFIEPWFWRIGEVVSLLTFLLLITYSVYQKKTGKMELETETSENAA